MFILQSLTVVRQSSRSHRLHIAKSSDLEIIDAGDVITSQCTNDDWAIPAGMHDDTSMQVHPSLGNLSGFVVFVVQKHELSGL